jgi:hypothetical protein
VIQSIKKNQAEVIVNKDFLTVFVTKLLFAIWQFFPKFGDAIYRLIGVIELNNQRVNIQKPMPNIVPDNSKYIKGL